MNVATSRKRTRPLLTAAAYGALFLLGVMQGLIGSFQYSRMVGSVPAAAIVSCALILATCLLGGWAMRSVGGAFAPAAGWIVASLVMSIPVSNGSVIISSTSAGKWYLYGGTVCALTGIGLSLAASIRARPR